MKKITFLSFLFSFVFATQANAQLNEGFDTAGLPTGWTETASSTYNWVIGATANNNSTVSPRSGAGMALFSANTYAGPTSRLETPSQDLTSLTSPMLTFYYTQVDWGGDQDELSVYYKDSATGTWTLISSYTSSISSWTKVELSLPNPSADYYIGFEGLSGYGYGITLDDVSIGEAPSCTAPGSFALSNSDSSSADISWVSSETAFNVEYGPVGFTQGSGTSDTTTTTAYTLNGLSSNTSYDVYVQTDCTAGGSGTSEWVGPLTITTPPSCGDTVNHCYDAGTYKIFDVTADITGDYVTVSINAGDTEVNYDDLVIYDTADNTGNVLYSADGDHTGQSATSTTGVISVWIQGDFGYNCTDGSGGPYTPLSMDITCTPPPACEAPTGITVSQITDCCADLSWTAGGSETDYEYVVQAAGTGEPTGAGTAVTGATTVSVGPYASNTEFEVYVRSNCGVDGFSSWAGPVNFTTEPAPIVPNYTNDFATFPDLWSKTGGDLTSGPSGTTLQWIEDTFANDGVEPALRFNVYSTNTGWLITPTFDLSSGVFYLNVDAAAVEWASSTLDAIWGSDDFATLMASTDGGSTWVELYRWDGSNNPGVAGAAMPEITLNNYTATSKFAFYGESSVFNEDIEFFIDNFQITTTSLGIEEESISQFTYFPNPVNDVLTIKAQKAVEDITVFNMLGQVVKQQTPNTMDCTVDLSAMQSGAYFVQVSIDNTVETVRVLKK